MGKIVSESQSTFLTGRYILDGPLIANEILSWARKSGKKLFLFKIDFDKAYDNVNWEFLLSVLDQMGFPSLWQQWIRGVLISARSSVLVNGSLTYKFDCQKGIRQGDPISPFLFILVMEAFSSLVKKADCIGAFDGVRLHKEGLQLSHPNRWRKHRGVALSETDCSEVSITTINIIQYKWYVPYHTLNDIQAITDKF
ncbi:putative RNA-directed DNA polymerase [Helianthus anomalus]